LDHKKPFSLVRIGDGENICLAQRTVWPIKRVVKEPWAIIAKRGGKGVTLPNLGLRDRMVAGIRRANVVGTLGAGDKLIRAPRYLKRPLTNAVFAYFRLSPRLTCDACINRYSARDKDFWKLLRGRRILLISKHAKYMKKILGQRRGMRVVGTIPFSHYNQIGRTLERVGAIRNSFDLALISAGVNAVILAPGIARSTGKVALDFGQWHKKM
jgi:hypothetical protein